MKSKTDECDFLTDTQKTKAWTILRSKLIKDRISVTFKPVRYLTDKEHELGSLRYVNSTAPPTEEEMNKYPVPDTNGR